MSSRSKHGSAMSTLAASHTSSHTNSGGGDRLTNLGHRQPALDEQNFLVPSLQRYGNRSTVTSRQQDILRQVREPGHSRFHTSRNIVYPGGTPPPSSELGTGSGRRIQDRITGTTMESSVNTTMPVPVATEYRVYESTLPPSTAQNRPETFWWFGIRKRGTFKFICLATDIGVGIVLTAVILVCVYRLDRNTGHFDSAVDIILVTLGSLLLTGYIFIRTTNLWRGCCVRRGEEWLEMGDYVARDPAGQSNNSVRLTLPPRALLTGPSQHALVEDSQHHRRSEGGARAQDGFVQASVRGGRPGREASSPAINEPLVQDWQLTQSPMDPAQIGVARTTSRRTSEVQRREYANARVVAETAPAQRLIDNAQAPNRRADDAGNVVPSSSQLSIAANEHLSPIQLNHDESGCPYYVGQFSGSSEATPARSLTRNASENSYRAGVMDTADGIKSDGDNPDGKGLLSPSPQGSSVYSANKSASEVSLPENTSPEPYSPLASARSSMQPVLPPLRSHAMMTEVGTPESQKVDYRNAGGNASSSSSSNRARRQPAEELDWSYLQELSNLKAREAEEDDANHEQPRGRTGFGGQGQGQGRALTNFGSEEAFPRSRIPRPESIRTPSQILRNREEARQMLEGRIPAPASQGGSSSIPVRRRDKPRPEAYEGAIAAAPPPDPYAPPGRPRSISEPRRSPERARTSAIGSTATNTPLRMCFRDGRNMTPIAERGRKDDKDDPKSSPSQDSSCF